MPQKIEITTKTILMIFGLLAGIWLLGVVKEILFLLFIAFIIMSALRPVVDRLESFGIPRGLAILTIYIIIISGIIIYGSLVFPLLINETVRLLHNLPAIITKLAPYVSFNSDTFLTQLAPFGQNLLNITIGIFSNIISVFSLIVFSFYFLLERKNLLHLLQTLIGRERAKHLVVITDKAEERMGAWVRGQLLLVLLIGSLSYLGLSLLGVNYALPLALIAGVLEFFPIIGPNISAIPAILVTLQNVNFSTLENIGQPIFVILLYFFIQQFENNIIVPNVMKRAVGMPPVISLVGLMVGAKLAGVLGAILAIPTILIFQTIFEYIRNRKIE